MKDPYQQHIHGWGKMTDKEKQMCKQANAFRDGLRLKPIIHPELIKKYDRPR